MRILNKLKKCLKQSCLNNKIFLAFLVVFFIIGIVAAIIAFINFKDYLTLNNLTDKLLLLYLKHSCSGFKYFILKFLIFICFNFIIILLCYNKYTKFLISFLILYLSYNLVFNLCLITLFFNLFGFIFGFIIIFVIGLIYIILLIVLALICLDAKNDICSNNNYFNSLFNIWPIIVSILVVGLIILLLETLLIPILSNTFVIIYV